MTWADEELEKFENELLEDCDVTKEIAQKNPKGCGLEALEVYDLSVDVFSIFKQFRNAQEQEIERVFGVTLTILREKLKTLMNIGSKLAIFDAVHIQKILDTEFLDYTDEAAKLFSSACAYDENKKKYPEEYDELRKEICQLFGRKYVLNILLGIRRSEQLMQD